MINFLSSIKQSIRKEFNLAENCVELVSLNYFLHFKFMSLSYHESNLLLIARETMRLLVNHQLISITIHPKSISLEQVCYKRSQGIAVTSLHCLLFSTSKNKDLKRISESATNVMLALKFLWTSKIVFP